MFYGSVGRVGIRGIGGGGPPFTPEIEILTRDGSTILTRSGATIIARATITEILTRDASSILTRSGDTIIPRTS